MPWEELVSVFRLSGYYKLPPQGSLEVDREIYRTRREHKPALGSGELTS